ncbi:TPA: ABC-three component system protein [Legionella feeleii]
MNTIVQTADGNDNVMIAFNENVSNISSILATVLPDIARITNDDGFSVNDLKPYDISNKIEYNNVKAFKEILNEYGQYGNKIDGLYQEFDNNSPGFIKSISRYFKSKYLIVKAQFQIELPDLTIIEVIQKNSDKILRTILDEFINDLKSSKDLTINIEELQTCALCVICHALINCKILEKPPDDC